MAGTSGTIITTASGNASRLIDVNSIGHRVNTPLMINSYSALTVPPYFCAVNFLADMLSTFPRSVRKGGVDRDEPHPIDGLLKRRANNLQTAVVFWRTLFFHAAHTHNGYALIERNEVFEPVALRNLMPEDVTPFRWLPKEGPAQQYYFVRSLKTAVLGENIIHLLRASYDGMQGMDSVGLFERTLQRAAAFEKFQQNYAEKGTIIRGAVEIPGEVSPERFEEIRKFINDQMRGPSAEDDILILTDGGKLNNATTSPQDAQLIEQISLTTKQISQLTRVPPALIFELADARYNNSVELAGQDLVTYTFLPWMTMIEGELSVKLLSMDDQQAGLSIHLNPGGLLRGSTKEQMEIVTQGVGAGVYTENEGRNYLGKPPSDDPEANKLKRLGDTSPGKAATAPVKTE